MKKYELTEERITVNGHTLHRIKAAKNFKGVKKGDLGGFIEKEENLATGGNAWVSGNARVHGAAEVCGNASVYDAAAVRGAAKVYGSAKVFDNAQIYGNAHVFEDAWIKENAQIYDNADISSNEHMLTIGAIGSRKRFTTFFRVSNGGICVKCGCFYGDIDGFLEKVTETHGNNRHARVYRAAAEIARMQIGEDVNLQKQAGHEAATGGLRPAT
ncbi:MAG: hypothetical protein NC548_26580 [Lachnospiraceae bacterium]|nr:hypothetical protein [Lachnospiraceae bacterium]